MTPEQSDLLWKARASLDAALVLTAQPGLEDFAVSRAYYTMFYVAEAFLLGEGLTFSKHSAVIAAFGKEFARGGRAPAKFHRYLLDGEDSRTAADYSRRAVMTAADAALMIARAQEFLDFAAEVLGPVLPDDRVGASE